MDERIVFLRNFRLEVIIYKTLTLSIYIKIDEFNRDAMFHFMKPVPNYGWKSEITLTE